MNSVGLVHQTPALQNELRWVTKSLTPSKRQYLRENKFRWIVRQTERGLQDMEDALTALIITTTEATDMSSVVMMPTPDPEGPDLICPPALWFRSEYLFKTRTRRQKSERGLLLL